MDRLMDLKTAYTNIPNLTKKENEVITDMDKEGRVTGGLETGDVSPTWSWAPGCQSSALNSQNKRGAIHPLSPTYHN